MATYTNSRSAPHGPPPQPDMEAGKTYVAVLPGHKRPAFVRKRKTPVESGFGLIAIAKSLGPARSRRSYPAEETTRKMGIYPAPTGPQYLFAPPPQQSQQLQLEYPGQPQPIFAGQPTMAAHPNQLESTSSNLQDLSQASQPSKVKIAARHNRQDEIILQHTCGSCGKFRSPSYHSRHPLAPGEIPKPTVCRKCIKERTSSEQSEDEEHRNQKYFGRGKRHKQKKSRERRRQHENSTEESRSISSGREGIRIIRRVRSTSRSTKTRRASRSSSVSGGRISIPHRPEDVRHRIRRYSDDKINIIERTRYVDRTKRYRSRSRSHGSSSWQSAQSERPTELRGDGYEHIRFYNPADERVPHQYRPIEYNHDPNHVEQYSEARPRLRRRSESMLAQHGTPFRLERAEDFEPRQPWASPKQAQFGNGNLERRYRQDESYEDVRPRLPSRIVRVLRVSRERAPRVAKYGDWDNDRAEAEDRTARFARRVSFDQPLPRRRVVEQRDLRRYQSRRRAGTMEETLLHESSDEDLSPGIGISACFEVSLLILTEHFDPERLYREEESVTPAAPWNPQERYLTTGPYDSEHELTRTLEKTRITPTMSLAPLTPPPPLAFSMRGRMDDRYRNHHRSRSPSYRPPYYRHATAGGTEQGPARYTHSTDKAVFYRDL